MRLSQKMSSAFVPAIGAARGFFAFALSRIDELVSAQTRIADVDLGKLHADTNLNAYHEAYRQRIQSVDEMVQPR